MECPLTAPESGSMHLLRRTPAQVFADQGKWPKFSVLDLASPDYGANLLPK
jgi:hypothetical protein